VDCNILPTAAGIDVSTGCSKERSLLCMDILQMSSKDEVGIGGDDLWHAVECGLL
jgi:hypothetical protein